jgi:hypothetical protein
LEVREKHLTYWKNSRELGIEALLVGSEEWNNGKSEILNLNGAVPRSASQWENRGAEAGHR